MKVDQALLSFWEDCLVFSFGLGAIFGILSKTPINLAKTSLILSTYLGYLSKNGCNLSRLGNNLSTLQ